MDASLDAFESMLAQERRPTGRLRIARRMARAGFADAALEVVMAALAAASDDLEVQAVGRAMLANLTPQWHFGLVRDYARNDAYEQALKRSIRPGMRVLEIGAGTGLLAMMAARAGAAEVITCEMNPTVAAAAQEIIEKNGYADRIKLIAKHSNDLQLGEDLTERAELLVSEIISTNVVGEHVLPAVEYARRELLTDDAVVIPAVVSARIALAETGSPPTMGVVSGFDLSPFNRLLSPVGIANARDDKIHLRSAPADLFSLHFQSGQFAFGGRSAVTLASTGGRVNSVVQWLHMEMDRHGTTYENPPDPSTRSSWGAAIHYQPLVFETSPGDEFRVTGVHDVRGLSVWAEMK